MSNYFDLPNIDDSYDSDFPFPHIEPEQLNDIEDTGLKALNISTGSELINLLLSTPTKPKKMKMNQSKSNKE